MTECPTCGQPMQMKFGIRFTRTQAAILDMIEGSTRERGGIDGAALGWVFFPGIATRVQAQRVKVHVCQINDMLVSTDWRIANERPYKRDGAFYKLALQTERKRVA